MGCLYSQNTPKRTLVNSKLQHDVVSFTPNFNRNFGVPPLTNFQKDIQ